MSAAMFTVGFPDALVDALIARVRGVVRAELATADAMRSPWLNVKSAATYLDTTDHAIYGLVKRGQIRAYHSHTGKLRFRREDLDAHARGDVTSP